jgi:hypothetical protein
MNFTSADKVAEVVFKMKDADKAYRSTNRANIDKLFSGDPPYTIEEEEKENIQINVPFPECPVLIGNAKRQWNNAFMKPANYFTIKVDSGPRHKRADYSHKLTKLVNREMKRSLPYTEKVRGEGSNAIVHGIAPKWWPNGRKWGPKLLGVEDLLVPSQTTIDFDNLNHFAIFQAYTQAQLMEFADSENNAGWNQKFINAIIADLNDLNQSQGTETNPEKIADLRKENGGYWESDAVPVVKTWSFFFRDQHENKEVWHKRVILDEADSAVGFRDEFLFDSKRSYGNKLSQILHVQFMDSSSKAPFKYHSVRGLGFLLYPIGHLQNRFRCRFTERAFQDLVMLFRDVNKEDVERLTSVNLYDRGMGILPEGLHIVPANERYQVNTDLAAAVLSQNRQMMSEASASFVQDVESSDERETATLTNAKMQTVNALVGAMLTLAYTYAEHEYREVVRRLVKFDEFIEKAKREGIPESLLDTESWDIDAERVIGSGNKVMEVALARELMQVRNLHSPAAQQRILHLYDLALTDDASLADELAPVGEQPVSNAVTFAEQSWATIMMGLPITPRAEFNHIEIAETWLKYMGATVQRLMQSGGMGTPQEIMGLQNAGAHIDREIEFIAQDENEGQRVKQYSDVLGKLMNEVKGMAQRLAEQMQNQQGSGQLPPEAQAKIVSSGILAQSTAKIKEASAAQKMQHKDQAFALDQRRKEAQHGLEMRRSVQDAAIDAQVTDLKASAEIASAAKKAKAQPEGGE